MDEARIKLSSSEKEFSTLNEIFDSDRVHNGDIITLLTDVTIGKTVTIGNAKRCVIDLNGHFIFIPITAGILVKGAADVKFINGKIQTLSSEQIEDSVIVQGSKTVVTLGENLEVNAFGTAVHVRKRGRLIVEDAIIKSTGTQPTIYVDDAYSILDVNRGSIASYEKSAITVRTEGTVNIHGGEIYTESNGLVPENTYPAVLINGKDSSLKLNDGKVYSVKTPAARIEAAGYLEINGGEMYTVSKNYPAVEMQNGYSSFKMSGGHLYATQTSTILSNMMDYGDLQNIQVTGGRVGAYKNIIHIAGSGDHGILFSGGAVKGELPQSYIAPGYVVSDIKDEEGYAPIILKTWTSATDVSPIFPGAGFDPDVPDDPFNKVPDSDMFNPNPFDQIGYVNTLPDNHDSMENVKPLPPVKPDPNDPFAPPGLPDDYIIPVPVPDDFKPDEPDHKPDDGSDDSGDDSGNDNKKKYINTSVNIRRKIHIYRNPSRKNVITEWRGALTIVEIGYFSPDGEEYALVKFRIPGSGKVSIGYSLVEDIIREGGIEFER